MHTFVTLHTLALLFHEWITHAKSPFADLMGLLQGPGGGGGPAPNKGGNIFAKLTAIALDIELFLIGLGAVVFTISVTIAGFMRATAFGSERRIAISNAAIACAVVGLLIILLADPVYSYLTSGIFSLPSTSTQ